jgi:hypothetical protein
MDKNMGVAAHSALFASQIEAEFADLLSLRSRTPTEDGRRIQLRHGTI